MIIDFNLMSLYSLITLFNFFFFVLCFFLWIILLVLMFLLLCYFSLCLDMFCFFIYFCPVFTLLTNPTYTSLLVRVGDTISLSQQMIMTEYLP